MIISSQARAVLSRSTFVLSGDVGVNVPSGIDLQPQVKAEIESLVRVMRIPVNEAAQAVLAALLEMEGLQAPDAASVIL